VIHGPNEAGKSTLLRALHHLLFGFPHQSQDAHLHPAKSLCVGATLRLGTGSILELMRHKRRKNDLLDSEGQVLEQSRLVKLLGGISPELFTQMFGIDQQKLRQGAEELLQAEGHLGQSLFAAASGIANLRGILNDLQTRQDKLFRPRATTSSIFQGASEISTLVKQIRDESLKPAHWKKLHQELQTHQTRQQQLLDELFLLDARIARMQRHRDALEHIELRQELSRQLETMQAISVLADDFTERRTTAQQTLAGARREEDRLTFRQNQIQDQLDNLRVNTALLDAEAAVQRLYAQVETHRKALKDAHALETRCTGLRTSITEKIQSLGRDGDQVPALPQPTRQLKVQLETLGRGHAALHADLDAATEHQNDIQTELTATRAELEGMDSAVDCSPLDIALARAADMGNPVQRIDQASAEIQKTSARIRTDLSAAGLWPGDQDSLLTAVLPLPETVDRFASEFQSAQTRLDEALKEKHRLQKARRDKSSRLGQLQVHGELPDTSALEVSRALRDEGWQLVKLEWLDHDPDAAAQARFTAKVTSQLAAHPKAQLTGTAPPLAAALEMCIRQADDLADALYANASSVAQAMQLRRELAELEQEMCQAEQMQEAAASDMLSLREQWQAVWAPLDIVPLSPREMLAWLGKIQEIRQRHAGMQETAVARDRLVTIMDDMADALRQALKQTGVAPARHNDFSALLVLAHKHLAAARQHNDQRRNVQRRLQELGTSLDKAASRGEQAARALQDWRQHWTALMRELELPANTTPEIAAAMTLGLEEIAQARRELKDLEQRIAHIRRDYAAFCRQVSGLGDLDLDSPSTPGEQQPGEQQPGEQHPGEQQPGEQHPGEQHPGERLEKNPEEHIEALYAAVQAEKEKRGRIEALAMEQEHLQQQLHAVRTSIQECQTRLSELCTEAGCEDPSQLPLRESQSRDKAQARQRADNVEKRLMELAKGENLESFIAEARAHQPDELSAQLTRLDIQKKELGEERDQCTAQIGRLSSELAALDGSSRAAERNQELTQVQARVQEDVNQYVRLCLASRLLSREIERYREANQGPVLEAASHYFQTMTLASFSGLLADYNDKGDPVLKAVRHDNQRLEVQQLSEGSQDQLFLALRLGGLTRYLQTNPALPFIADDILVNFDDQRSAATLRTLAQIAASTQVIFLTHHAHLVRLARECIPPDQLSVHDLSA